MFTANMYVDVYRASGDVDYSEYSDEPAEVLDLIHRAMPELKT